MLLFWSVVWMILLLVCLTWNSNLEWSLYAAARETITLNGIMAQILHHNRDHIFFISRTFSRAKNFCNIFCKCWQKNSFLNYFLYMYKVLGCKLASITFKRPEVIALWKSKKICDNGKISLICELQARCWWLFQIPSTLNSL